MRKLLPIALMLLAACEAPQSEQPTSTPDPVAASGPEAAVTWRSPGEACSYLRAGGSETRGYKQQYEERYACSSDYYELGQGSPLANNVAYYVYGSASEVEELKLVLNVNQANSAAEAHEALAERAAVLTQSALGQPLPEEARSAIISGTSGEWEVGKAEVRVVREDWPTGRGYGIHYMIS